MIETTDIERSTVRTVSMRLMPLLCLIYFIAYVDRQNISFAKLQMAGDIGLDEAAFGLGAALFFIGYFLFEVPSNLILTRVGVRRWFARIMASWGLVTVLLALTPNGPIFYALRFLLGVAEAGLFPGVLYALTLWFPRRYRAGAIGLFMIGGVVANVAGSAIAGILLDMDGMGGLRGWQWVFIVTGLPAILLTPIVLLRLPDGPDQARWLSDEQRRWLSDTLAEEHAAIDVSKHASGLQTLTDPRVLLLCATFVGFPLAAYGLSYWLPTIIRGFGVSNTTNGLLNALLWVQVGIALWLVPRLAARRSYSVWQIITPAMVGAAGLAGSVLVDGPVAQFLCLCVAASAIFAGQPIFWTLPPRFLSGVGAAAGIAAINATGNLGGFAAQALVPRIAESTGSATMPMLLLAAALLAVCIGVFSVERLLSDRP